MPYDPTIVSDDRPPRATNRLLNLLRHRGFLGVLAFVIFFTSAALLPGSLEWMTRKVSDYRTSRLYKSADAHFRGGRFAEAIEDYSLILAIDSENLYHCLRARSARRDCYVALGTSYKALADADCLVREFDTLADVVIERGEIHLRFGNYQAAIADSEAAYSRAATERDPNLKYKVQRNAAFLRARIHEAERQFDAALNLLSRQAEVLSVDEACYAERALLQSRLGNFSAAFSDFERALQLEVGDATITYSPPICAKSPFAHFLATCPDEKFRDGKRAMDLASSAAAATKYEHPAPLLSLAAACAEMGNFSAAVKWEQQANKLGVIERETGISRLELYQQSKPYRFPVKRLSPSESN